MHIAIVHYHLQPGGVFQVIANHLQSLKVFCDTDSDHRVAIFHGGLIEDVQGTKWASTPNMTVSTHAIAGLGYDAWPESPLDSAGLAANILSALQECKFSPADSVLHVHNHSLGKNVSLPGALQEVANRGYPLLLQIHDFAEDFRDEQYQRLKSALGSQPHSLDKMLYPQANHIHYAVLNGRDRQILTKSGLPTERLHPLPNPIVDPGPLPDRDEIRSNMRLKKGISIDQPLVIYPVRGIRRKNLGELLLWSALFNQQASFGATLAPQNEVEKISYGRWKSFAEDLRLPCYFELGDSFSFKENLAAADALITTSVAEGFGMVFLETQLVRRPLLGRKLPEITSDFENNGVDLSLLYQALHIPIDFLGKDRIYENIFIAYCKAIEKFGASEQQKTKAHNALNHILSSSIIDFAMLTPSLQKAIISDVVKNKEKAKSIRQLNPLLKESLSFNFSQKKIDFNAAAVQHNYAPSSTGAKLINIYEQVMHSSRDKIVAPLSHGEKILESFLSLERFRPIRSMS